MKMLAHKTKWIFRTICVITLVILMSSVSHADSSSGEIISLRLCNWGTYPAANIWMSCGADFGGVQGNEYVQFFLVNQNGKPETQAIAKGSVVKAENVFPTEDITSILQIKQDSGFPISGLEPGEYWVGCKLEGDTECSYQYEPFTVYSSAKEYVKAGLDKVIESYLREPDGWFWLEGEYVGLGYTTDTYGNSWEAWMFPALGNSYILDGHTINCGPTGSIMTSYDGRHFRDLALDRWPKNNKKLWTITCTELFKFITAFCACGENPRDIDGYNLVNALIQCLYNADGSSPVKDGVFQDTSGLDTLGYAYMILGLEIAGATPAEGYTSDIRDAAVKYLWDYDNNYSDTPDIMSTPDWNAMSKLALPFYHQYPRYRNIVNKTIGHFKLNVNYNMYANGAMTYSTSTDNNNRFACPNADSLAVVINTLVSTGTRVEDFDKGEWTQEYGSLLTSLMSCVVDEGVLYGDKPNRMATYQTLGALIDLYNNRSCFDIAHEKYKYKYPEYFEDNYGKLTLNSLSTIDNQVYTGKALTPRLEVIGSLPVVEPRQAVYGTVLPTEKELKEGEDYTVTYENNIQPGKATVTVTGIGDYRGTLTTTFNIVKKDSAVKPNYTPARAAITKLTKGKKAFVVKWKKVKNASYYQIQYSTKKNFKSKKTVKVKKYLKKGKRIGKLKSKRKYYVRVRAVRKAGGKTWYGKWSKVRSVKLK